MNTKDAKDAEEENSGDIGVNLPRETAWDAATRPIRGSSAVKSLLLRFSDLWALRDVSFEVKFDETAAFAANGKLTS